MENLIIRVEKESDFRNVENLVRESFWNVYRPGCTEHFVLHKMRNDSGFIPELSLIMEENGNLIGQSVFYKTSIKDEKSGIPFEILSLGPICISPDYKRKGYGKKLLDFAFDKAKKLGFGASCFEGNFDFYGKCGCKIASTKNLHYEGVEDSEAGFFLCKELEPGFLENKSGTYSTPEIYFTPEKFSDEFKQYDETFPYKEKLKLPSQIF